MKKNIKFSKGFLPCAIVSAAIIIFGIVGLFTKGINLGLDFKPGLIEEVRIAPAVMTVSYTGNAKASCDLENDRLDVIISGTGAENETKSYLYSEYKTVAELAKALNAYSGISAVVKTDGSEDSASLFVSSAVSTQLKKEALSFYSKNEDTTVDAVRDALKELKGVSVKELGSGNSASFQIRMAAGKDDTGVSLQETVNTQLGSVFGADKIAIISQDFIGAGFSKSLAQKSILLLVLTIALIWVYAAFRFHWDFALGSVIALLHDTCIMFTFIVWSGTEFTTTVLAAVLTIIGYSINATVVILDRVRYNLATKEVKTFNELLDSALSDTLGRSIITTLTTSFAVLSLYIFTTGSIKDFAAALIVGLVSGCYSSIYISSGFISLLRRNWKPEFGIHHSDKGPKGVLQSDGIQL